MKRGQGPFALIYHICLFKNEVGIQGIQSEVGDTKMVHK